MQHRIEIILIPSADDPSIRDRSFQEGLSGFAKALRATGVTLSQLGMAFDSVDATGYPLAEFVLKTLLPAAITAATAVCVAWVNGRAGRKLRLKVGDVEAEGQTAEEIRALLKQASEFREIHSKEEEQHP